MDERIRLLLIWLGVTSALACLLFGWDKAMAKLRCRRVPETVLLSTAIFGGAAGALIGMLLFRHKTRKPPFPLIVPLSLAAHLSLVGYALLAA